MTSGASHHRRQRPKILVVGVRWPPETFLGAKFRELAARDLDITVAAHAGWRDGKTRLPGVKVIRLPHPDDPVIVTAARFLWALAGGLLSLRSLMAGLRCSVQASSGSWLSAFGHFRAVLPLLRLRPGAIHFEWLSAAADWLPFWDLWKCPVVVSCRGRDVTVRPNLPGPEAFRRAVRATFEKATAVHCVSEAIRRDAEVLGLDRSKAWVIRPAVDPVRFRPSADSSLAAGPLRIVSVGSLNWWKGHEYSLAAVKRLRDSGIDANYEIVGAGPRRERQRLRFTIDDLGLSGHVTLSGAARPDEVLAALQRSNCFILPSLTEGISNAVLEAMACGLPVVTTDCGGMREAVTDGAEGFVVKTRDIAGMAAALERLSKDSGLRRRLGEAARLRVLGQFALGEQIDALAQLYESVIGRNQPQHQAV